MFDKFLKSSIILLFAFIFLIFSGLKNKQETYKILKIVEADKFYVDFNKDNLVDSDELVKLSDIIAFSPIKTGYTSEISSKLGISDFDFIKTGYIARNWAKDNLEGKYIKISSKKVVYTKYSKYYYINATLDNKDLGLILLEKGFAVAYKNSENYDYYQAQNLKTVKENLSLINKLKFLIVNKSNNIVHKLSCEFVDKIKYAEIILEKQLNDFNLKKCGYCFKIVETINDPFNLKSKNSYKKSVYKKFNEIELFLINPLEFKMPSSSCNTKLCQVIVSEINNSKTSIDIALYGYSSQNEIFNALKSAKSRGVNVRAVMDYSKNTDTIYKDSSDFVKTFGATTDKTETLMHNKFFIFDNKKVLTGSANISSSGSGGYNANIMVLINSSKLADYYKEEFEQMYSGKFQKNKKLIKAEPVILSNSIVTPYFSPKSDVYKNAILPLVQSAKKEIFVSIFYLTDKRLVDELILAKKRGVNVVILWDALGAINFKNLFNELRKENVIVKAENWGGKNHEKTILADNKLLIGSANFSLSGFNKNDENVLVIENSKISNLYRDYFIWLFNSIDRKYYNFIPRAEGIESVNSCFDNIDNNFDGFMDKDDEGCKIKKR